MPVAMHCREAGYFRRSAGRHHFRCDQRCPAGMRKALNRLGFTSAICDLTSAPPSALSPTVSYPVRPLCKFRSSSLAENPYPTPHSSDHPIRSVSCRTEFNLCLIHTRSRESAGWNFPLHNSYVLTCSFQARTVTFTSHQENSPRGRERPQNILRDALRYRTI